MTAIADFFAFARPGNWFVSKIPPLLAVAYLEILRSRIAPYQAAGLLVCCLFSIFCVAIYGHVLNDIFDQEADRLANKVNRLATMRPVWRGLLPPALLAVGFLPAFAVHYSIGSMLLLTLNYLWPTIYSIPFTRLKERGLFGVACDALGSHITPTLFVLGVFSTAGTAGSISGRTGFALTITLWAAVLGLKGILHHQIADRENDIQSGVVTFATKTRPEILQRFLTGFNLLAELPVSALLTAMVSSWCPLAIAAFLIYIGSETAKYLLGFQFALTANPATIRASVPFANEMFYVLWMPIAAATQIGLNSPVLIPLPIIQAAIFHQPVVQQVSDWLAIVKNATLAYRGRFSVQGVEAGEPKHGYSERPDMKAQDIVRLYSDAYARRYEKEFLLDPLVRSDTEAELRLIERFLIPGVSWLDVACGTGFFLRHFPNADRAGIDLSPAMLRLARDGNPGIPLLEHDFREPIPEWENRWGLVSCMWYAYGFADTIGDLEKLVANLSSWTSMTGTCFVPLADPRLITGVNLPYQAPTQNAGRVMITGILWSYLEDEIGAAHTHLLAPNIEFMIELFGQYFEHVEIMRYPPAFEGWEGRPALVASGKKNRARQSDDEQGENATALSILQGRITALKQLVGESAVRETDLCELNAASEVVFQARITAIKQILDQAAVREIDLCELVADAEKRVESARAETAVHKAHVEQLEKQLSAARAAIKQP